MHPKKTQHKQDEDKYTPFDIFCFLQRKIEILFHFLLFSLTFLPSLVSEKMKEKAKNDILLSRESGVL